MSTPFRAVRHPLRHALGRCPLCGRATAFLQLFDGRPREGMTCLWCRSPARKRHVALALIQELAPGARTASQAVRVSGARVLSAQSSDALSRSLASYERFETSEYVDGTQLGSVLGPRSTCQDLERLTFDDSRFDVVITEDVLEHVRDDGRAFAEIHRVLVPGGRHVFTVPLDPGSRTLTRVDTSGDEDIHLVEPEYHGDPVRGHILAYRTYGYDLLAQLEAAGFVTRLLLPSREDARAGVFDSVVLVSTKLG